MMISMLTRMIELTCWM